MNRPTVRAVLVVVACGLAGCRGSSDAAAGTSAGSLYVAVVRHLDIPTLDPTLDGADERAIVLVADLSAEPLSLDDQVAVINDLDADYDVRFVDQLEAATEIAEDGSLVPPTDGRLVAIGTPKDEDGHVYVRVETTGDDDEIDAWQLRLSVGDAVRVVDSVDIEPELLVPSATP